MDARIRAKERYSSLTLTDMVRAGQIQLAAPIAHKAVQLKFVVREMCRRSDYYHQFSVGERRTWSEFVWYWGTAYFLPNMTIQFWDEWQ